MKVAIVADIHSNLQAMSSVLDAIRRERVDLAICAGDIVGYGANPNECARAVKQLAGTAVLGNHDWAALSKDTKGMNPYAAAASMWTSENIDEETSAYLRSLKIIESIQISSSSAAVCHGSVSSYLEYMYEEDVDDCLLERAHAELLVLGHTHIPYVKNLKNGLVVNPGSVGQPRDGDPRASFAIYDSDSKSCRIRRADYDIEGAARTIVSAGLPRMLAERLYLGR